MARAPCLVGERNALADAAGNPIWSRDARGIEMDRTFDGLSRPLTESSNDGTTVKLRRAWAYVAYSSTDSASKAKNLFGRSKSSATPTGSGSAVVGMSDLDVD